MLSYTLKIITATTSEIGPFMLTAPPAPCLSNGHRFGNVMTEIKR